MKIVRENINFERNIDPKKAMGIGKYKAFRNIYSDKPFLEILFNIFLNNLSAKNFDIPEKLNYRISLFYGKDDEGTEDDTIYFSNEKLYEGWGFDSNKKEVGLEELRNTPTEFFEYGDEERTLWSDPNKFNSEIIDPFYTKDEYMDSYLRKYLDSMVNEWFEIQDFRDLIGDWMTTGYWRIHDWYIKKL